ncbi:hypothetical protein SBY92_000698 [Candida maltosa Xu316]
MLRIFHFESNEQLKSHHSRYEYTQVSSNEEIDVLLETSKHLTIGWTEHPRYLRNYATLRKGMIELRSTSEPGYCILVNEHELVKAVYQYYNVKITDFRVFYSTDNDLDFIEGKINCTSSRPVFTKIEFQADSLLLLDEMNSIVSHGKYSPAFYYINSLENKIEFSASLLSLFCKTIEVDKITSVPLSHVDLYKLFGLNPVSCGEGSFINNIFDKNDIILSKYDIQC